MILDKNLLFSDGQSLAINAASAALSDHSIDLGTTGTTALGGSLVDDIGRGKHLEVFAQITTAAAGASSTLQVQLVMADDAALTSNLTVLAQTTDIAVATLAAGYQFRLGTVPAGITKRYLGLKYLNNDGTHNMTGGNITAGLVADRQTNPTVG